MFPLKDDIAARHFPMVNVWLIIVNVLFFSYEYRLGSGLEGFVAAYGFIPARFIYEQQQGMADLSSFVPIFTSMFLHGNMIHLISNMWILWIFGDNVEDCMGHGRYIIFYLLCGVVAVFAQTISQPGSHAPMIGASGAISGVLGAYLFTYPRARILTLVPIFVFFTLLELPAYFFLVLWFLLQFVQGAYQMITVGDIVKGGVAWWAHVGGFVSGAMMIIFFRKTKRSKETKRLRLR